MILLVTGGRSFASRSLLESNLARIHAETPITRMVTGGALGADHLAGLWAHLNGLELAVYPAEWDRFGSSAGPIRNARMLAVEHPDLVVAFPGGPGTRDMVTKALAAGIPVLEIPLEP